MDIPVKELLTPNIATMISTFLTLLFMYILFKKYLFGPTRKFLVQRQKYIMKNIKDSEQQNHDAKDQLDKAQKHLEKTTKDSAKYLAQQMENAKEKAISIVKDAKEEINNLKKTTKNSLEIAEIKARKNLRKEVASLSIEAAKKILNKELDDESSQELVEDFIEGIK